MLTKELLGNKNTKWAVMGILQKFSYTLNIVDELQKFFSLNVLGCTWWSDVIGEVWNWRSNTLKFHNWCVECKHHWLLSAESYCTLADWNVCIEICCYPCLMFTRLSHTGEYLGAVYKRILDHWEISTDKVHLVLWDNTANMAKAKWEASLPLIGCFARSLHLVVEDDMLSQCTVKDVLTTCRIIVGHFKHSSVAYGHLCSIQEHLGVP